jgi:hypothetical protein
MGTENGFYVTSGHLYSLCHHYMFLYSLHRNLYSSHSPKFPTYLKDTISKLLMFCTSLLFHDLKIKLCYLTHIQNGKCDETLFVTVIPVVVFIFRSSFSRLH